jgi:anti-sigma factor RsiW
MRLSCEDIEPLLQEYLEGHLLPSQREILDAHLRACPSCAALFADLSRIDDHIERLEPVEAPAYLARRILNSLPEQAYHPPLAQRFARYAALPALAAAMLVAVFLFKGSPFKGAPGAREVDVVFVAPAAATVSVVGDFNGWDPRRNPMTRGAEREAWRTRLVLPPGVYQYSFVVDGTVWEKDPQAKNYLADGFGGENSVIIVDG